LFAYVLLWEREKTKLIVGRILWERELQQSDVAGKRKPATWYHRVPCARGPNREWWQELYAIYILRHLASTKKLVNPKKPVIL
jgi:hypothetical protein